MQSILSNTDRFRTGLNCLSWRGVEIVYRELRYHDTSNIIRKYQANNECVRKVESFSHCTIKRPLQGNIHGLMV